ncbi:hypothetical protein RE6C_01137 [Rhodopirellula europaea 6C]|uniref:Uncharacterized protein n=1 Tax=Rhodopirellula europaea 6C TaxID=1263867 RepID=M2ALR6_9BACT|nr:hypothetical protein RE6C_01137 [Rhodopirellula europaea 6C]
MPVGDVCEAGLRGDEATDKRSIQKRIDQTPEPADGDHNIPGETTLQFYSIGDPVALEASSVSIKTFVLSGAVCYSHEESSGHQPWLGDLNRSKRGGFVRLQRFRGHQCGYKRPIR